MTRDEIVATSNAAADRAGIPRQLLLAAGIAESNLIADARRPAYEGSDATYWPDVSMGAWQQTVRWAAEYRGGSAFPGAAEIERVGNLYLDPVHAADVAATNLAGKWKQYQPDMLATLCAYNWPAGGGKPASTVADNNYRRGLYEADQILGAAPMPITDRLYGPDVPDDIVRQRNPWSCAIRSTYAALWQMAALGQGGPVTYGDGGSRDVYDWMVPTYDSADVGLHQANGAGLVEMLRKHGYKADRISPATLEDVQERAGKQPVLLGLNHWGDAGHWVYVRGVEEDGTLILENPAGTYEGISNQLRDSFARLGPATMVWIEPSNVVQPAPAPAPSPLAVDLAPWINALSFLGDDIGDDLDTLPVKLREAADTIQRSVDQLRRVRTERVGPRPA